MKTHDLLLETVDVEITSNMSRYASYTREYILDLYHERATRDEEVNLEEAEELINELVNKTKINLEQFTQKIKSSFNIIDDKWTGSKILILVRYQEGRDFSFYAADDFSVKVYKVHERGAPDFTVFTMGQHIDDILDAGDTDFFVDADVENDYFLLVNLLRNPEVFSDPDRALWLYTARPKTDRHIYDRDNKVPSNIFLTSDPDEAFGYAHDFEGRDVYKIKVKQRYLTQTLDNPNKKNYQTISKTGWVPVESIDRLTEAKLNEAKNSPAKRFLADIKQINFHRIFVKFDIFLSRDTVELDQFYAEDPGLGAGTLAMEVITKLADKHGVSIKLIMDNDSDVEALERFYTKFDFVESQFMDEMIRRPQNRKQLNESKKMEWVFGAYYITTQIEAEKIRENEFDSEVKKGPLGKGIYFTGEEFTAFESLEKIVIQIRVELNNPLIVRTESKEELVRVVKQTDFDLDKYDGVLWLDPLTDDLQRGISFIASNVYYERNPYDLYEGQLNEKAISVTNRQNEPFKIYQNPTKTVIQQLAAETENDRILRALLDFDTGSFYIWNGYMAIHDEVIRMLGLDPPSSVHFSVWPDLKFEWQEPSYEVGQELKKINPDRLNSENMITYLSRLRGFKLPVLGSLNEAHDPYKEYEISYVELIERLTPATKRFLNKQFEEDYNYTKNLAAKIKDEGWDNKPLILTPEGSQFSIYDGNHRINAIRKFGLEVPYIKYRLTAPREPLKRRV